MLRFTLTSRQIFFSTFHVTFIKIMNIDKSKKTFIKFFCKRFKRLLHPWCLRRWPLTSWQLTELNWCEIVLNMFRMWTVVYFCQAHCSLVLSRWQCEQPNRKIVSCYVTWFVLFLPINDLQGMTTWCCFSQIIIPKDERNAVLVPLNRGVARRKTCSGHVADGYEGVVFPFQ